MTLKLILSRIAILSDRKRSGTGTYASFVRLCVRASTHISFRLHPEIKFNECYETLNFSHSARL